MNAIVSPYPAICSISTTAQVDAEFDRIDGQIRQDEIREDIHLAQFENEGFRPGSGEPIRQDMMNVSAAEAYKQDLTQLRHLLVEVAQANDEVAAAQEPGLMKSVREFGHFLLSGDWQDPAVSEAADGLGKAQQKVASFRERLGICAPSPDPAQAVPTQESKPG